MKITYLKRNIIFQALHFWVQNVNFQGCTTFFACGLFARVMVIDRRLRRFSSSQKRFYLRLWCHQSSPATEGCYPSRLGIFLVWCWYLQYVVGCIHLIYKYIFMILWYFMHICCFACIHIYIYIFIYAQLYGFYICTVWYTFISAGSWYIYIIHCLLIAGQQIWLQHSLTMLFFLLV